MKYLFMGAVFGLGLLLVEQNAKIIKQQETMLSRQQDERVQKCMNEAVNPIDRLAGGQEINDAYNRCMALNYGVFHREGR